MSIEDHLNECELMDQRLRGVLHLKPIEEQLGYRTIGTFATV